MAQYPAPAPKFGGTLTEAGRPLYTDADQAALSEEVNPRDANLFLQLSRSNQVELREFLFRIQRQVYGFGSSFIPSKVPDKLRIATGQGLVDLLRLPVTSECSHGSELELLMDSFWVSEDHEIFARQIPDCDTHKVIDGLYRQTPGQTDIFQIKIGSLEQFGSKEEKELFCKFLSDHFQLSLSFQPEDFLWFENFQWSNLLLKRSVFTFCPSYLTSQVRTFERDRPCLETTISERMITAEQLMSARQRHQTWSSKAVNLRRGDGTSSEFQKRKPQYRPHQSQVKQNLKEKEKKPEKFKPKPAGTFGDIQKKEEEASASPGLKLSNRFESLDINPPEATSTPVTEGLRVKLPPEKSGEKAAVQPLNLMTSEKEAEIQANLVNMSREEKFKRDSPRLGEQSYLNPDLVQMRTLRMKTDNKLRSGNTNRAREKRPATGEKTEEMLPPKRKSPEKETVDGKLLLNTPANLWPELDDISDIELYEGEEEAFVTCPLSSTAKDESDLQVEKEEEDPSLSEEGTEGDEELDLRDPHGQSARRVLSFSEENIEVTVPGIQAPEDIIPEVAERVLVETGKPLTPLNRSTRSSRKFKKLKDPERHARYLETVRNWENRNDRSYAKSQKKSRKNDKGSEDRNKKEEEPQELDVQKTIRWKIIRLLEEKQKAAKLDLRKLKEAVHRLKKSEKEGEEHDYETVEVSRKLHQILADPKLDGLIDNSDVEEIVIDSDNEEGEQEVVEVQVNRGDQDLEPHK